MYPAVFVFIFGILFLYLKTPGFVDMFYDFGVYVGKKWMADWKEHEEKIIMAVVGMVLIGVIELKIFFKKNIDWTTRFFKYFIEISLPLFLLVINRNASLLYTTYF